MRYAATKALREQLANAPFGLGLVRLKKLGVGVGCNVGDGLIFGGPLRGVHTKNLAVGGGDVKTRHSVSPV